MGVIPLQFKAGENADTLGLTGKEQFTIDIGPEIRPGAEITVKVTGGSISEFKVLLRFDTETEVNYYKHGGVLPYVVREALKQ